MAYDFCPDHAAHKHALERHEKQINAHSAQIDEEHNGLHQIEIAIQRLTDLTEYTQKRIDQSDTALAKHEERIQALEDQPANDARRVKEAALAALGGAIGTGVIGFVTVVLTTMT